jgi:hypothetical protein
MPATRKSQARTRTFARVTGPWLVIVPGIMVQIVFGVLVAIGISPMWVGSPSLPHHRQRTTRETNDAG